jgi:hypothetical protein
MNAPFPAETSHSSEPLADEALTDIDLIAPSSIHFARRSLQSIRLNFLGTIVASELFHASRDHRK